MKCEDCKYWVKVRKKKDEILSGQCRRNPPSQIYLLRNNFITIPLRTFPDYWCGEFQPKEGKANE